MIEPNFYLTYTANTTVELIQADLPPLRTSRGGTRWSSRTKLTTEFIFSSLSWFSEEDWLEQRKIKICTLFPDLFHLVWCNKIINIKTHIAFLVGTNMLNFFSIIYKIHSVEQTKQEHHIDAWRKEVHVTNFLTKQNW